MKKLALIVLALLLVAGLGFAADKKEEAKTSPLNLEQPKAPVITEEQLISSQLMYLDAEVRYWQTQTSQPLAADKVKDLREQAKPLIERLNAIKAEKEKEKATSKK